MKGQLTRRGDEEQEGVELQLSSLGCALALLEHDALRIRQAMARDERLAALLGPVLADFERVARSIRSTQEDLREKWDTGQIRRWE